MNYRLVFLLLLFSIGSQAQTSAGILAPSRAIDWSKAGVVGGIPSASWTQCGSTIAAGASLSTIQTAINNCSANHYVQLGAGTFTLTTGINLNKSNVALRGMGTSQTFLVFTGAFACDGGGANICIMQDNTYPGSPTVQPGQSQAATWSGGYTQGATQITLTNVGSSGITNGEFIYLDQANGTTVQSKNFFVCDTVSGSGCSLEGGAPGRIIGGVDYNQIQFVKVTAGCASACTGAGPFTLTITPGLYGINWSSSFTPGAWWPAAEIQFAGLENLSIDATNGNSGGSIITFRNAFNCWVSGVRSLYGSRNHVWLLGSAHNTIQNSYFFGVNHALGPTSYGVESYTSGDNLIINNIFQSIVAPVMMGPTMGSVFAYNFGVNDVFSPATALQQMAFIGHDAGAEYQLFEGNIGDGFAGDPFHGTSGLNTMFRNRSSGWEIGRTQDTIPIDMRAYNRVENVIGNVLGQPGYHNTYQIQGGSGSSAAIYDLGAGDTEGTGATVANDPLVASTMMRWGNYDTFHNSNQWNPSEVPVGISPYGNAVPSNNNLPSSFFLNSQPGWWPSGKAWPPIGPDVTGGNMGLCSGGSYSGMGATSSSQCAAGTLVSAYGGRVNSLPAMDCYFSMGGPPDGSGNALSFNASACYPSSGSGTGPAPPTGLAAAAH